MIYWEARQLCFSVRCQCFDLYTVGLAVIISIEELKCNYFAWLPWGQVWLYSEGSACEAGSCGQSSWKYCVNHCLGISLVIIGGWQGVGNRSVWLDDY